MTRIEPRIGFYAGSFDPITYGHLDIIHKALRIVDTLVVGIGTNPKKAGLFTAQQRQGFIEALAPEAHVIAYQGLLTRTARDYGASLLIRGLRNTSDFAEEFAIAGAASAIEPELTTVWLPSLPAHIHIPSSLVKEIAQFGGDVSAFVPPMVASALQTINRPT